MELAFKRHRANERILVESSSILKKRKRNKKISEDSKDGEAINLKAFSKNTLEVLKSPYYKGQFEQNRPFSYVVIDNFLVEEAYECLIQHVRCSPREENKSTYGLSLGRKIMWGACTDIGLLKNLYSKDFLSILSEFVGEPVLPRKSSIPQIVEFLPGSLGFDLHNDCEEEYDLVTLLYLQTDNLAPYGGELSIFDRFREKVNCIKPIANRFVMFKVSKDSRHAVENIGEEGGSRFNLTLDWILPMSQRAAKRNRRGTV